MPDAVDPQTTFVPMMHPDVEGTAMTTIAAFEEVHQDKGWVRVTDQNAEEDYLRQIAREHSVVVPVGANAASLSLALNPDLADAENLESMKADEVKAVAEAKGVSPKGTKAEVIDRIHDAEGEG